MKRRALPHRHQKPLLLSGYKLSRSNEPSPDGQRHEYIRMKRTKEQFSKLKDQLETLGFDIIH